MTAVASLLYLVDGDSLLYRAAHAIPYFTNSAGLPTNALHGFATMLRILIQTGHPTHVAVAFTADPPLRKHTLDRNYKINHYEHPEEIKQQIPFAMRLVAALGLHPFLEPGFEADDVIATLLGQQWRLQARIVSSDRDFFQLVSDRVHVLTPVRGVSEVREVGPAEVYAAFGVLPEQIPDLKALVGDPSDDIPGVRGIGPKTAAALLRIVPTVEAVMEGLDTITIPGVRGRLAPARERVLLNKQLARFWTVPLKGRPGLRVRPSRKDQLEALARETEVGVIRAL